MNKIVLILLLAFVFNSCLNMTQDVDINLPEFEPELVVESYLEADSFYRVSVSESVSYFETPDSIHLITGAFVTITHKNITDTLRYYPPFSIGNFYPFGEYRSEKIIPRDYDNSFYLYIRDDKGREG